MEGLFIGVLNMSFQTGIVVCFILLARWVFNLCRVPKKYSYVLWMIPFVRFACPVSFQSVFSLLPRETEAFHENTVSWLEQTAQNPQMLNDVSMLNRIDISGLAPAPQYSADPLQLLTGICSYIWCMVAIVLVGYSLCRLFMVMKKLRMSICLRDNIYLTDEIDIPFVIGLIKPRIYLPSNLEKQEQEYVVLHEQTHIRRHDAMIKMVAYLITLVHWFNPLAWVAFFCMTGDMEMSCDEAVMEKLGQEKEAEYAKTLLRLSVGRRRLNGLALAFGEGNTKGRVKNIMKYKKPLMITGVFALLVIAALVLGLLTDPVEDEPELSQVQETIVPKEDNTEGEAQDGEITQIEIITPQITPDMLLGADGTMLDYAGNELIIFHDYYGLFVFSMRTEGITELAGKSLPYGIVGAVDLAAIGCQDTQGSNSCEVNVSSDGSRVYLHPMEKDHMYVYEVYAQRLTQQKYSLEGEELFDSFAEPEELMKLGACSHKGVRFEGNPDYYGYMSSSDYTVGSLRYVEYDMIVPIFENLAGEGMVSIEKSE